MANRFKMLQGERNGSWGTATCLLVDQETGVQYLFARCMHAGGLTVLVDREGKPLLAKDYREE